MRILLDEPGLVSDSDGMLSCGRSVSCSDDFGCDCRGGGGGILSGGVCLLAGVTSSEAFS